jgi:hypothetical protein
MENFGLIEDIGATFGHDLPSLPATAYLNQYMRPTRRLAYVPRGLSVADAHDSMSDYGGIFSDEESLPSLIASSVSSAPLQQTPVFSAFDQYVASYISLLNDDVSQSKLHPMMSCEEFHEVFYSPKMTDRVHAAFAKSDLVYQDEISSSDMIDLISS